MRSRTAWTLPGRMNNFPFPQIGACQYPFS
jgi:hypothetical protein